MFSRKKPDVLVVGAGPVGLYTALALHERGLKVEIIDREWRTGTRSYACALHSQSLRWLEELGVLSGVLDGALRIRRIGLYDETAKRAELRLQDLAEDHAFLAVLRQEDLENMLVAALERRGVKITWNHQVGRVVQMPDHCDVTVEKLTSDSSGYAVQHSSWFVSKATRMEVPYVVGADGHRSAVRRALEIDYPAVGPAAEFAVFEFRTDADLGDEMRLILADDHTDLCWPLPGGFCRWSFQRSATDGDMQSRDKDRDVVALGGGLYPALGKDALRALLEERAPWFEGSVEGLRWRMVVRFEQRLAAFFGGGRVWLAGDSAHLTGPAGVQSMNVGFREGRMLAAALASGADATLMRAFDAGRQAEWKSLLGIHASLRAGPQAEPWIADRVARLLPCIPASGADLARLCGQVGLEYTLPTEAMVGGV